MTKRLWVLLGAIAFFAALVFAFRFSSAGTEALWSVSRGGTWLLPLLLVAAAIDSVNPCAFSILLITVAFLMSMGRSRGKILAAGGFYIAGIFVVYLAIGVGLFHTLHLFNTPHFMAKAGAALLIAFGALSLVNEFFPNFPVKLKIPESSHRAMALLMERASLPAAFLLGALVGLCEFPCTGGPYLMALGLLHDHATYWNGFGYLLLYNLVFVLPLVLLLLLASDATLFGKVEQWKKEETGKMRFWGGFAMIALGALIFLL